jgi:hypothetical protein
MIFFNYVGLMGEAFEMGSETGKISLMPAGKAKLWNMN